MHVVCLSLASLVQLITLDEGAGDRIELLELEVAGSLIVAKRGGNSQILRAGIEDDVSGLTDGRAHPDCSHVDSIVSTHQGHLKTHVILVVLLLIADLGDELLFLNLGLALSHSINGKTGIKTKSVCCINAHFLFVAELKQTADILRVNSGERLLDVSVLRLSELSEVVGGHLLNMNLTIIFLTFFEILELDVRYPVLLELNAHNLATC